jgi:hypothetical protein
MPPSVDFNPVPQVRRLVPAFGLVFGMTCLCWHSAGMRPGSPCENCKQQTRVLRLG